MSAVLITYDLNSPGQKYEKVITALKSVTGTWCKITESSWIVAGSTTVTRVYDSLSPFIDGGDRVFVVDITAQPRQGWLTTEQWDWIKKHV